MTVRSRLRTATEPKDSARSVLDTFASEALMEYARECRDKAAAHRAGLSTPGPTLFTTPALVRP